jgi:hypothetical protein
MVHFEKFAFAVTEYLGQIELTGLECVEDPRVERAYALRATYRKTKGANRRTQVTTFLLTDYARNDAVMVVARKLEEVEFATWPPTSH